MQIRSGRNRGFLSAVFLACVSLVHCAPYDSPTGQQSKESCAINDVLVRVWSNDRALPAYQELTFPRGKVGPELQTLLGSWVIRDSTARIEVINRHCAVDALPQGSPAPSC